ncbi:probable methyltransferase At1g29790 [Lolium rigidum]|uniref:probable methyltransferase At1g29790 n=1 Tax=Lolium rigidum TaxID=89674 RepID=UPI001F5D965E|nr:probable methyltransferase At1g29790 [Lolium rigidum]
MEAFFCLARCRFTRLMVAMQLVMGVLVICISTASLHRFYTTDHLLPGLDDSARCSKLHTAGADGYASFDMRALSDRVDDVLVQLAELQDKLEATALKVGKKTKKAKAHKQQQENMTMPEFRRFLEEEVIHPLYSAHISLRLIRIPRPDPDGEDDAALEVDPLVNFFMAEETRKYVTTKGNREGRPSVYGTNRTYGSIGHACVLMRQELDEYMSYDVGAYCPDDWDLGQRLMLGGCDPLPRRRCLTRASKLFNRTLPINESLWTLPDDGSVRWTRYHCRGYKCLSARNPRPGYTRCVGCFDMDREKQRWMVNTTRNASSTSASLVDFSIDEVLAVKPGEVRIGLDVSVGTGTFAARMRERGVTVVSAALNLGAPFAETVALRGLVPLYATMSQRLPFFDNTMDLVHTAGFFEGWVDLQLLDFVLFDWDRVLRPGGLLWVDRFACARRDLDDYMYMFLQFRYKKHRWVVSFKSKEEVYLSALLEKPPRS